MSSRDIQPNQRDHPARLDIEDPAFTIAIKHHTSGHLRLDGHGAVYADRRTSAHIGGKIVHARCNQDLVNCPFIGSHQELLGCGHVP